MFFAAEAVEVAETGTAVAQNGASTAIYLTVALCSTVIAIVLILDRMGIRRFGIGVICDFFELKLWAGEKESDGGSGKNKKPSKDGVQSTSTVTAEPDQPRELSDGKKEEIHNILARTDDSLTVAVMSENKCEDDYEAAVSTIAVLNGAQEAFQAADQELGCLFVVSLKVVDGDDESQFLCHHTDRKGVLPPYRRNQMDRGQPSVLRRKGTLTDMVWSSGNRASSYIRNIDATDVFKSNPEALVVLRTMKIKSMRAWPIYLNGEVVAVLKVDSDRPHMIDDGSFLEKIGNAFATKMTLAFAVSCRIFEANESAAAQLAPSKGDTTSG